MGAKLDADVAGAGAVDTSKFSGEEHEQLFQAEPATPGRAWPSHATSRLQFHAMPLSGNSQDLEQAVAKTSTGF